MGYGFFDYRLISGSPWATLSLSVDANIQDSLLKRSYFMPSYSSNIDIFPTFPYNSSYDYLLDPKLAWEQTVRKMQQNPALFTTPGAYNNGGFTGGFSGIGSNWQFPQITPPWQQKPETEEEKAKREAREQEDKKDEAKTAKALNDRFNDIKKVLSDLGSPLAESLIKRAEDAMKEEKAEDRLKEMKAVLKLIPEDKLMKAIYAKDDVKSLLVDGGFNISKFLNEKDIYTTGKNGDSHIDWRTKAAINDLYQKLKKDNNKTPSVSIETFVPFAASINENNILGIISNWNDVYHSDETKSILRHVANNLPDTSSDAKIPEKEAAKSYVEAIENLTKGLLTRADNWSASGNYPKLKADRNAVQNKLNEVTKNSPDNLTKSKIYALADAFDQLYARLRMMEAERINQHITSKYKKDFNEIREGLIDEKTIIKETEADLKSENITKPEEVDNIEKSEELREEENNRIEAIGPVTNENIQSLVDEGQLIKVPGKDGVYRTAAFYKDATGHFVSKQKYEQSNGEAKKEFTPIACKYYKLVDNKLVPATLREDGVIVPDTSTQATSSDILDYNYEIAVVQDLVDEKRIKWLGSVGSIIPKYPLFKAETSNDYFIWRNNQLLKIKNVKEVTAKGGAIRFKIDGVDKAVTLEKLYEDDDNFETFVTDEIKTEAEIKAEKEAKAKAEAKKKKDEEYKKNHPHAKEINNFKGEYNELTYNKCKSLGIEELKVKGWFVTTSGKKTYYKFEDNKLKEMKQIKEINEDGSCVLVNGKRCDCPQYGDPKAFAIKLQDALAGDTDEQEENRASRILRTFINYKEPEDIISFLEAYEDERTILQDPLCMQLFGEWGYFNNEAKYKGKTMLYKEYFVLRIAEQVLSVIGNIKDIELSDEDTEFLENLINVETGWFERNVTRSTAMKLDYIIKNVVNQYREQQAEKENQDQSK